jgi:hypothetical protein
MSKAGIWVVEHTPLHDRPVHHVGGTDDWPLIIVNADDPRWRIPIDELDDMAREVMADRRQSEHVQGLADRQREFDRRMLEHFERRGMIASGTLRSVPKGRF